MSAPNLPPFTASEFVYHWLSRPDSPLPDDEREQASHDVNVTSAPKRDHVKRDENKAEQENIPHLPSGELDRVPKSVNRHRHNHKSATGPAVQKAVSLPYAGDLKNPKKALPCHSAQKRLRSGRNTSEADADNCMSVSCPSTVIKSRGSSFHSRLSNRSGDSAFQKNPVAAAEDCLGKKYERRPRYKTRPDKYKIKVEKRTVENGDHDTIHQNSRRKRRNMTGLALSHDFKSQSISQGRLTLKPSTTSGIFHKGKASAPVECQGLPDLTFSELNFLSKRGGLDDARHANSNDEHPSKKGSNKTVAQEISHFFSRPKQHDIARQGPKAGVSSHRRVPTTELSTSPNKVLPARPGVREPLCVVSGNDTGARAFSATHLGAAARARVWVPDPGVPKVQRYSPARVDSVHRNPSNSMTSYYSWSATPSQKSHRRTYPGAHSEPCQFIAKEPSYEPRPPSPPIENPLETLRRSHDQSWISDRSLEQYTKHVLLGGDKQGVWDCVPRASSRSHHYTLQELKRLARLSELDDVNRLSTTQSDQHRDGKGSGGSHILSTGSSEHNHVPSILGSHSEGLEPLAARLNASISSKAIFRQKGAVFMGESSADPAARGPQVAQSERQGLFTARPADRFSFRDSTRLGNMRFSPDRVAGALSRDLPAPEAHNCDLFLEDAERIGTHSSRPIWRMLGSGYMAGPNHELLEPRYLEYPLTAPAHIKGPIGQVAQDKELDHLQVQYEGHQHDHWIGHGTFQDAHHQDFTVMLSDNHDEFDKALLSGPNIFVDGSVNILDEFRAAQFDPAFVNPTTELSSIKNDLPLAYHEPIATARDPNSGNIDIGTDYLEENSATNGLDIDQMQRSRTWQQRLNPKDGDGEINTDFMGFAKPHILY